MTLTVSHLTFAYPKASPVLDRNLPTLEELLWGRTEELARWTWPAVRARYRSQLNLGAAPQDGEPAGESPHATTESGVSAPDGELP